MDYVLDEDTSTVESLAHMICSMSFFVELQMFMGSMLVYAWAHSIMIMVVLWEWLGLLSYILIQHWSARSMGCLASTKSVTYNKTFDVLVLGARHLTRLRHDVDHYPRPLLHTDLC